MEHNMSIPTPWVFEHIIKSSNSENYLETLKEYIKVEVSKKVNQHAVKFIKFFFLPKILSAYKYPDNIKYYIP